MAATSGKAPSKGEILNAAAEQTGLSRKQVAAVFESLSGQIGNALGKKGTGTFTVPGLMKITIITKPATKARKGINPFTKLEQMFKAKPARKVVKVRPLKSLKDMAKKFEPVPEPVVRIPVSAETPGFFVRALSAVRLGQACAVSAAASDPSRPAGSDPPALAR
jgi:nucleoid DNA-binding protein